MTSQAAAHPIAFGRYSAPFDQPTRLAVTGMFWSEGSHVASCVVYCLALPAHPGRPVDARSLTVRTVDMCAGPIGYERGQMQLLESGKR
jgi:hypothetical protein